MIVFPPAWITPVNPTQSVLFKINARTLLLLEITIVLCALIPDRRPKVESP